MFIFQQTSETPTVPLSTEKEAQSWIVKTGKPQASCQHSTSAPSAPICRLRSEHCPATTQKKNTISKLPGANRRMTASNPSKNPPAEILPPFTIPTILLHLFPRLQSWHTTSITTGASAKHKNRLFISLLLQIGSTQDVHFHALCLLQLFKWSFYARKHKLMHKPTGHFITKEVEM